jgi:hypothetical protein
MRHPMTILCGYFTAFVMGMCIVLVLENIKVNKDSLIALFFHIRNLSSRACKIPDG